ncbi:aspartate racemase [Burkholderiales bacterium JOSHI_001]|nr:aspartate racemase [Burkholderiales bacterium JOSHI_001]
MPTILPPGGAVDWPRDEGVLGVVGVAPWATLDFLRALYARVPATKDWHFPRVIADINTKLPSRGRHLELGETDPSPFIAQTIAELAAQGATVVVVPCNTAHLLYERWAASAVVPVPHIVQATVAAVQRAGARRVATFTSASLRRHGLFQRTLQDAGLQPVDGGDALAAAVAAAIDEVKRQARIEPATLATLRQGLQALRRDGVDALVLGCTELTDLQPEAEAAGLRVAESNAALAQAALELIQPKNC